MVPKTLDSEVYGILMLMKNESTLIDKACTEAIEQGGAIMIRMGGCIAFYG